MNLGARLYAYTGNQTYRNFAQDSWEWMESIGLIASDYQVFDGSDDTLNCTELDHTRWSYNAGMVLHTAAVMWNKTENQVWRHRVNGVWNASQPAFLNDNMTMYESACEPFGKGPGGNCNLDQQRYQDLFLLPILARLTLPQLQSLLLTLHRRNSQERPLVVQCCTTLPRRICLCRSGLLRWWTYRNGLRHQMDNKWNLRRLDWCWSADVCVTSRDLQPRSASCAASRSTQRWNQYTQCILGKWRRSAATAYGFYYQ